MKRRQSSARSHSENWIEQREELKRETVEEQDEEQTETGKPTDDRFSDRIEMLMARSHARFN